MSKTLPFRWAQPRVAKLPAAPKQPPAASPPQPKITLLAPLASEVVLAIPAPTTRKFEVVPPAVVSITPPEDLSAVIAFVRALAPQDLDGLRIGSAEVVTSGETFLRSHLNAVEESPFTPAALTFYRRLARLREILDG